MKKYFLGSSSKKLLDFHLNVSLSVFYGAVFLWCYLFLFAVTHTKMNYTQHFIVESCLIFFILSTQFKTKKYSIGVNIFLSDLLILIFLVGVWVICIVWNVNLHGDELAHYRSTNIISIKLINFFPDEIFNFSFKYIVWLMAALEFSIYLILIKYLYSGSISKKIIILYSLVILFRVSLIFLGWGNAEPYPPLRLIFPLFSTALFGVSSLSAKLPALVILLSGWLIFKKLINQNFDRCEIITLSFFYFMLPGVISASSILDFSIFAYVAVSLITVILIYRKDIIDDYWPLIVAIVGALVLVRPSLVVILSVLIIRILIKRQIRNRIDLLFLAAPVFLCFPFIFQQYLFGSNAFYLMGELKNLSNDHYAINRVIYALKNGTIWAVLKIYAGYLTLIMYLTYPFIVIKYCSEKVFLLAIFFGLLALFFTLRVDHWGTERYQVEYLAPFALISLLKIIELTKLSFGRYMSASMGVIFCTLFLYDQYQHSLAEKNFPSIDGVTTRPYSVSETFYLDALNQVRNFELLDKTAIYGVTYGEVPFILANYSVGEIKKILKSRREYSGELYEWGSPLLQKEIKISDNIEFILLIDLPWDPISFINQLIRQGWFLCCSECQVSNFHQPVLLARKEYQCFLKN